MGLTFVSIQPVCVFWLECLIHLHLIIDKWASLVVQMVEIPQVQSLGQEDPLEKGMATLLLWKPHGLGRLAGYSPWGHKELNATERLKNNNI